MRVEGPAAYWEGAQPHTGKTYLIGALPDNERGWGTKTEKDPIFRTPGNPGILSTGRGVPPHGRVLALRDSGGRVGRPLSQTAELQSPARLCPSAVLLRLLWGSQRSEDRTTRPRSRGSSDVEGEFLTNPFRCVAFGVVWCVLRSLGTEWPFRGYWGALKS